MWRRSVCAEEQTGNQTATHEPSIVAREISAAIIEPSPFSEIPVGRNIAVAAENTTRALPEIGNDHDIGLVISGAGFDPCLPLTHVIGCPEICVPVSPSNLQAAELVDQEEVDHASDRIGSVHSRGAILEDVDVIDHRKGDQVNVRATAKTSDAQRAIGDPFAIDQNQSFLRQEAAQVELDGAVTAVANIQVDGSARLLRDEFLQVGGIADT